MIAINKNSAINSLQESLVPDPFLIDGRTEKDWLCFITEFGSLINFYNDTNTIEGNWNPFLMKDPVFLLASISKTNYKNFHSKYKYSCREIQQLIQNNNNNPKAIDQLFGQITTVFKIIERWTFYMIRTNEKYDLKSYILNEVKTKFSVHFWAIQSFRHYLYGLKLDTIIIPTLSYNEFINFDPIIWNENKDKKPFWEVFGYENIDFINDPKKDIASICLEILTKIGDQLFHFFETIIHHSVNEFETLSKQKSRYPDTTLLRSFVKTLKIQQKQMNGISQKHLDFYYKDILKESISPAIADTVFLCADLTKNNTTFNLPSGTLFDAGVDQQKKPILFISKENKTLNPAKIIRVQTLCYQKESKVPTFNLQTFNNVSSIQKDDEGKSMAWKTFGGLNPITTSPSLGFAFASPLLLLREGNRTITITIEFDSITGLNVFQNAKYFLSTQKEWLSIKIDSENPNNQKSTENNKNKIIIKDNLVTLSINLDSIQVAIEPFLIQTDGLNSEWPMFKILFDSIANLITPPKIKSISINVEVIDAKSFKLYNDYGELNTKNPFPPFGQIPLVNSSFIIGNNEIFSKPLDSFEIEIEWDELPGDFQNYYQQYNNSLTKPKFVSLISKIGKEISELFSKNDSEPMISMPFNNECFKVNFKALQEKKWNEIVLTKNLENNTLPEIETTPTFVPVDNNPKSIVLFTTAPESPSKKTMSDSSSFFYNNNPLKTQSNTFKFSETDPSIQNKPLKYDEKVTSGFLKMTLTGPEYGFGSDIYPNIVANIALYNGNSIARKQKFSKLLAPANLPFVPKIKSFSSNYSAYVKYNFNSSTKNYPFDYFLYTPFLNIKLFDNSIQFNSETTLLNTTIVGVSKDATKEGLPLYSSFNFTGALFIELADLVIDNTLNIYFELARNTGVSPPKDSVKYFYLTNIGWNELEIISDGTNEFKCSGIIELSIPSDCNNNSNIMSGNNNWIAIAVEGNLDSYSKTVFLKTNGFSVQRIGSDYLLDTNRPRINSNTINKPHEPLPQIATITQPFPSFGGKAAEDKTTMNQRVSNTIKTKNRAITVYDYYSLITQKFNEIYFLKVYNPEVGNNCTVFLVKKVENENHANAFIPLITNCLEIEIKQYLEDISSPFTKINVSNFDLEYVIINAIVEIEIGYQKQQINSAINNALNLYLSPWIKSDSTQITIEEMLLDTKVTSFIKNIEGVATVNNVSFSSYTLNPINGEHIVSQNEKTQLNASSVKRLLVSSLHHKIIF